MSTWTNLRVLPLIAAVAFAAGCKDKEKDEPTDGVDDSDSVVETADTGDEGPDYFLPTQIAYQAYFAVDEAGDLTTFKYAGAAEEMSSFFLVTLSDERDDSCLLMYEINPAAWGYVDTTNDTDDSAVGPADLIDWLEDNDLLFGWRIGPNDYEPFFLNTPDSRCADLPEDVLEIAHGAFFDLTWDPSAGTHGAGYIGFKPDVDDELVPVYEGTGVEEDQIVGGRLRLPFNFGTQNGQSNFFEITATWGLMEDGEIAIDSLGLPAEPQPADAIFEGNKPAAGYYTMFSPSVLTISWN